MVFGVPTVILYGLVRTVFPHLTKTQAILVSVLGTQLGVGLIASLGRGLITAWMWGELVLEGAGIAWLVVRPGRGPAIAFLAYEALGLLVAGLAPLLRNPWGSTMHKAAATALLMRLIIGYLLVRALREAQPASNGGAEAPLS